MRKRVWMFFDLGFNGNYASLYRWLDEMGAEECGDNTATFFVDLNFDANDINVIKEQMRSIIPEGIFTKPFQRCYIIVVLPKGAVGTFLYGKRKRQPWIGYASSIDELDDE